MTNYTDDELRLVNAIADSIEFNYDDVNDINNHIILTVRAINKGKEILEKCNDKIECNFIRMNINEWMNEIKQMLSWKLFVDQERMRSQKARE